MASTKKVDSFRFIFYLKRINGTVAFEFFFQSPKKVNLVAALVRGMRVEDALMQLQLTVKRASKTVYQVKHYLRMLDVHLVYQSLCLNISLISLFGGNLS